MYNLKTLLSLAAYSIIGTIAAIAIGLAASAQTTITPDTQPDCAVVQCTEDGAELTHGS
ncbi:MAG: hypothetical protein ACRC62_09990 [Microcoleus sp.]